MEKIERKTYEAPQLTAVVFKSERGFAVSFPLGFTPTYETPNMIEERTTATSEWGGNDWNVGF